MKTRFQMSTLLMLCSLAVPFCAYAPGKASAAPKHSHAHSDEAKSKIYQGYFETEQVKTRELSDWTGKWHSVYPYLLDGTLDPVFKHKAEQGEKSFEDYRKYYELGYKTDVTKIVITDNSMAFTQGDKTYRGTYLNDGFEILTYAKGNRGVRYIFKKADGDASAPEYVQFSDHGITPEKSGHFHLYWGKDRKALLQEVTNWPTYYPWALNGKQVVREMLAH